MFISGTPYHAGMVRFKKGAGGVGLTFQQLVRDGGLKHCNSDLLGDNW